MRLTREQVALLVSAPLMASGLVAVALAPGWPMRLGGTAMVLGASVALGVTGRRLRWLAWALAALGAVVALVACL